MQDLSSGLQCAYICIIIHGNRTFICIKQVIKSFTLANVSDFPAISLMWEVYF